ncbi:MAG: short-subunit dehydrogenase [Parvicella sp.]|jgi:short-subunit dehydrogenase
MKTALVTGASSGIGYELSKIHAQHGGDLVVVARSVNKLNEIKLEFEELYNIKVHVISKDLTGEYAAKEIWDELSEIGVTVDYLINNAGVGEANEFVDADLPSLQLMIQLNITSLMNLCYYFIQEKKENNKPGKILNIASTAGFQGVPYMAVYSATKSFVVSFTEALAVEYKEANITVTALCPGPTKTNFGASSNLKSSFANFALLPSAHSVAKYGYSKMMDGDVVVVHGVANKLGVAATKATSRQFVSKVSGQIFKRTIKK